jgi:hypothetical protein
MLIDLFAKEASVVLASLVLELRHRGIRLFL